MKKKLILFIKGFVIGIGKIIPGVSGGMLAISLGVYDKGIDAIANFFKNPTKHLSFLVTIGLGVAAAVLIGSSVIVFCLNNHYFPTMLLFIGLIGGGIPALYSSVNIKKRLFYVIIPIILMIILTVSSKTSTEHIVNANFISLFLIGLVEAFAMVVPGVSGTALLMLLGYYETIMKAYSNFDFNILFPFLCGTGFFALLFVKMTSFMLYKHSEASYAIIFGFALSSLGILFFNTLKDNYQLPNILVGLLFLVIGYSCSKLIDNKNI